MASEQAQREQAIKDVSTYMGYIGEHVSDCVELAYEFLGAEDKAVRYAVEQRIALQQAKDEADKMREALTQSNAANERNRSSLAQAISAIFKTLRGVDWMASSRGCYECDDVQYQKEFGSAVDAIHLSVDGLRTIAADWSNCPNTTAGIRAALLPPAQSTEKEDA